jgi:uncharacterized protein YggE
MKSSMFWALLVVAVATSAFSQIQTCTSPTGRSVTVNGSATLHLVPDRVSFSVGVETESANVAQAFKQNTAKVNQVIADLKQRGVTSQQIQTSNFSITSRDQEGKKLDKYRVSNLVTVTRESTADVGELLQAAVSAGANEAGSLQFFVANQRAAELQGLEMAFQNARVKAEKLAALSGKVLGDVHCVSDQGTFPAYGYAAAEAITVTASAPSIETGVQDLGFRVSAVFELRP